MNPQQPQPGDDGLRPSPQPPINPSPASRPALDGVGSPTAPPQSVPTVPPQQSPAVPPQPAPTAPPQPLQSPPSPQPLQPTQPSRPEVTPTTPPAFGPAAGAPGAVPPAAPPTAPVAPPPSPAGSPAPHFTPPGQPAPGPRSKKKLFFIIGGIIAGLAVAAAAVLYFISRANDLALTTYEAVGFSVQVPTDYEKQDSDDPNRVEFRGPEYDGVDGGTIRSSVVLQTLEYGELDKQYFLDYYKSTLKEEIFADFPGVSEDAEIRNFSSEQTTLDGRDAWLVTFDTYEKDGGQYRGSVRYQSVFGDDAIYDVVIAQSSVDTGLAKKLKTITDSVTPK